MRLQDTLESAEINKQFYIQGIHINMKRGADRRKGLPVETLPLL
jgi:hypothetical protein